MKFSEAEKYFNVVAQLMPQVSNDNPMSVFEARANLIRYQMVSNIEQAMQSGKELKADVFGEIQQVKKKDKEFFGVQHKKDISMMMANLHLLNGNFREAK